MLVAYNFRLFVKGVITTQFIDINTMHSVVIINQILLQMVCELFRIYPRVFTKQ